MSQSLFFDFSFSNLGHSVYFSPHLLFSSSLICFLIKPNFDSMFHFLAFLHFLTILNPIYSLALNCRVFYFVSNLSFLFELPFDFTPFSALVYHIPQTYLLHYCFITLFLWPLFNQQQGIHPQCLYKNFVVLQIFCWQLIDLKEVNSSTYLLILLNFHLTFSLSLPSFLIIVSSKTKTRSAKLIITNPILIIQSVRYTDAIAKKMMVFFHLKVINENSPFFAYPKLICKLHNQSWSRIKQDLRLL